MAAYNKWFEKQKGGNVHGSVFDALTLLRNQQWNRIKDVEINRRLYTEETITPGRSTGPGSGMAFASGKGTGTSTRNRFSENLIKSCVDTIYAKIAKNSPLPLVTSDGGDGSLRRKAKDQNKFLWGKFDELKIHKHARLALRDALALGTGCLKIDISNFEKNIAVKRIMMNQIFVDAMESQYGKPSQLLLVVPSDKRLLKEQYPQFAAKIQQAAGPNPNLFQSRRKDQSIIEEVELIEAWKLPDQEGEKGRHVIVVSNETLVDEDWDFDQFPFVFIHFEEPMQGFWGDGIAKIISDIQFRVNYTLLNIAENIRLCGKPTWLVPQAANIPPGTIRNSIGNNIVYKGNVPPSLAVFATTHPEVFKWLDDQRQQAYKMIGLSELSAQSTIPKGVKSGIAMETYNDIESERFIMLGKQYEEMLMSISNWMLKLTTYAYENRKKLGKGVYQQMFLSNYSRSWQVKSIDWKDVNMKRDEFNLQIFPVSSLPQSPSGRQEKIQEYIQQGMIDKDTGRELLDFPDYTRWANLQEAGKDNAERIVENLWYDDVEEAIEEYHDLAYMLRYAQTFFNQMQMQKDVDEQKLDRLRDFIDKIGDKISEMMPPNSGNAPPAPASPPQSA